MILRKVRFRSLAAPFAGREVTLDFAGLPPGVYAFVGGNGQGKTTALEALLPGLFFRQFPSYAQTLQQKATGRDCFLEGFFQIGPDAHRIVHQADPEAGGGRGKTESYWYSFRHNTLEWHPEAGPLLKDFDAYRDRWISSLPLLLAGSFCAQKVNRPNGSFFAAAPADRKALLVEALALDRLQERAEEYTERVRDADRSIAELEGELRGLKVEDAGELRKLFKAADRALAQADVELSTADAVVAQARNVLHEWQRENERIAETNRRKQQAENERRAIARERQRLDRLVKQRQEMPTVETLNAVVDAHNRAIESRDETRRMNEEADGLQLYVSALEGVDLSLELCQRCRLTQEAQRAAARLRELIPAIAMREVVSVEDLDALEREANDLRDARSGIPADLDHQCAMLAEREAALVEVCVEPAGAVDLAGMQRARTEAEARQRQASAERDRVLREHAELEQRLKQAEGAEGARRALVAKLEQARADRAALELLAQGLGRNGLQAVYIDQAAPALEQLTNDLLHSTFGGRFSIAFETRRLKKGKKAGDPGAYSEVFDVRILDAWQQREGLQGSGGETVWFDTAFRLALAIYMTQTAGREMRTLCFDEPSGGLDQDFAPRFTDMLKAARKIGGFHHVFMVSHQREVWGGCDGFFVFKGGTVTYCENVEDVDRLRDAA